MTELRSARPLGLDRERLGALVQRAGPWTLFAAALLYVWRVNPFTTLQAYGDTLEFVWGSEWYWTTLLGGSGSPLYAPHLFYPGGWHTATLAFTPSLFLASLPFRALGGPAFAYNGLAILGYVLAFAGAHRFARLYTDVWPATLAALVYAFMPARGLQGMGHLNIFVLTALLPWLLYSLERGRRASPTDRRWPILAGLAWGGLMNCALYGVFIGALGLALWGRDLFRRRRLGQLVLIGGVALLVGAPVIWLYTDAVRRDAVQPLPLWEPQYWGASLNSLAIPSVAHPWPVMRQIAGALYRGIVDESVATSFGLVTFVLAGLGVWRGRTAAGRFNLLLVTLVSFVAALGLWLKWDGQEILVPWLAPINAWLWAIGHQLKPTLFPTPTPPPEYATGIPLPGFVLTVLVPFWEAARTTTRHAYLGSVSLVALAAVGLRSVPRPAGVVLTLLWLAEAVPIQGMVAPLDTPLHPAHAWVVAHAPAPDTPILEMHYPNMIATGGEIVMGTLVHGHPTVGGTGANWPAHMRRLHDALLEPGALAAPETARLVHQNGIRYILVQQRDDGDRAQWASLAQNPLLRPVGCFEPNRPPTPWWYPLCVAEVTPGPLPGYNLTRGSGWSNFESWGVWAEGVQAEATWTALAQQPFELSLAATPHCLPNRPQTVSLEVNGQPLATHHWTACEEWRGQWTVPAAVVRAGTNTLTLRFAFAASPVDPKTGQVVELRQLSVGFSELAVRPLPMDGVGD